MNSSFQERLNQLDHIKPGPEYFEARRRLWLAHTGPSPPKPSQRSEPVQNLLELFRDPETVNSKYIWETSLRNIWKYLSTGSRLKSYFPLPLLIKILHAAWLRDHTWPPGATAPDSDDERQAATQIPAVPQPPAPVNP